MTILISDFLPEIRLEAPGCPDAILLNYARNAVRDFCQKTHVWTEDLYPVSLAAGYAEYDIDLPPSTKLVTIRAAKYNGAPLSIYTTPEMDAKAAWRDVTGSSVEALISDDGEDFLVYPIPIEDDSDALLLNVALKPTKAAISCGEVLAEHNQAITHGTLAYLKAMPKKEWTDRESVPYHGNEYMKRVNGCRINVINGRSAQSRRVPYRKFG